MAGREFDVSDVLCSRASLHAQESCSPVGRVKAGWWRGGLAPWCAWQDKDSKQRLKAMAKCSQPITDGSFSADGAIYGYAAR